MPLSPGVLQQLTSFLVESSRDGLFPIVGYSLDRIPGQETDDIILLTTSIAELPLAFKVLRDATGEEYNLGRFIPRGLAVRLASENPHVCRRHCATIPDLRGATPAEVGNIVKVFGAPFYKEKAFGLVDICGFSKLSQAEQLSQLYSLTNILRSQRKRVRTFCSRLRVPDLFGTASTGDGFYLWHEQPGGNADIATFMLLTCIVTQAENMRRDGFPMRLRAAFIIGAAFMLYDADELESGTPTASNAVGAATNGAARLITATRPSQFLVGDFSRPGQGPQEMMTPQTMIAQASQLFREERFGAATLVFLPDTRLRVVDKHGTGWYCWNLVGEIPNAPGGHAVREKIGVKPDSAPDIANVEFQTEP